jgi:hypothetical protein
MNGIEAGALQALFLERQSCGGRLHDNHYAAEITDEISSRYA